MQTQLINDNEVLKEQTELQKLQIEDLTIVIDNQFQIIDLKNKELQLYRGTTPITVLPIQPSQEKWYQKKEVVFISGIFTGLAVVYISTLIK